MNIVRIDNENDKRLDIFYRKDEKQLKNSGLFIGESELVINRALENDYVIDSLLIRENKENDYLDIINKCDKDVLIYEVSDEVFSKLKGFILLRDILACFKRKKELSIEDITNNAKRIVVLEDVANPTNVGAIFRNSSALNADGIVLTTKCPDPLYRRSLRTSMGNVFKINYCYVDDYIDGLHKLGFKTVALALRDDAMEVDDERLKKENKLAVILGSEGYGMKDETISASDYVVKIKMNPDVDSLNVASASGIALWELCSKSEKL